MLHWHAIGRQAFLLGAAVLAAPVIAAPLPASSPQWTYLGDDPGGTALSIDLSSCGFRGTLVGEYWSCWTKQDHRRDPRHKSDHSFHLLAVYCGPTRQYRHIESWFQNRASGQTAATRSDRYLGKWRRAPAQSIIWAMQTIMCKTRGYDQYQLEHMKYYLESQTGAPPPYLAK
jgi:hypothetical protein